MKVSYTDNFYWRDEENFPHYDLFKTIKFTDIPNTTEYFNSLNWVNSNSATTIIKKKISNIPNVLFKIVSNNTTRYYYIQEINKELPNSYEVTLKLDIWSTYIMNNNVWNKLINTSFNFIRSPFFHKDTLFITDPKINSIISNIDNRTYFKESLSSSSISFPSSLTTGYEYSKDSLYAVFHINPADISYNSQNATSQYFVKLTDAVYYNATSNHGNTSIGYKFDTYLLRHPVYVFVPLFGNSNSAITERESIGNLLNVTYLNKIAQTFFANSSRGISKLVNATWWTDKFIGIYEGIPFSSWRDEDIYISFLNSVNDLVTSPKSINIQNGTFGSSANGLFISFFCNQLVGTKVKGFDIGLSSLKDGLYVKNIQQGLNYIPLLKYLDLRINGGNCNLSAIYYHSILNGLNGSTLPNGWVMFNNKFVWTTKTDDIPANKTISTNIEFPLMSPYSTSGYSSFINSNQNSLDTSASNKLISGITGLGQSLIPSAIGMDTMNNSTNFKRKQQQDSQFNYGLSMFNSGLFGMINPLVGVISNIRNINANKMDAYNSSKPMIKASDIGMLHTQENASSNYSNYTLSNLNIGGCFLSAKDITEDVWNSLKNYMYLYNYYCYQYKKIGDVWDTTDCGYFETIDDNVFIKVTQIFKQTLELPLITNDVVLWLAQILSRGLRIWLKTPN